MTLCSITKGGMLLKFRDALSTATHVPERFSSFELGFVLTESRDTASCWIVWGSLTLGDGESGTESIIGCLMKVE